MSFARKIPVAVLAALSGGVACAGDPTKVDKADLEKLLPGKTINYSNINGSSAMVHFGTDGRLTYKAGGTGKAASGTWSIDDSGRYCVKITSGTVTDHCRNVWKTDAGYSVGTSKGENLIPVSGME